jgi:hypothetical protein
MSNWRSLECVPKDRTDVLLWVPDIGARPYDEGIVVVGYYDSPLDGYFNAATGDPIEPICWMPTPRGPRNLEDIQWTRS